MMLKQTIDQRILSKYALVLGSLKIFSSKKKCPSVANIPFVFLSFFLFSFFLSLVFVLAIV